MQNLALSISLVIIIAIVGVFLWVVVRSGGAAPSELMVSTWYRLRSVLFVIALASGAVLAICTMAPWPHDAMASQPARRVEVHGRQWVWEVRGGENIRAGDVVEFIVTAEDVNHSFALYGPEGTVLTQVQAMPGFVNRVRHRFAVAGKYQILCLEYCGVAHHGMAAELNVASGG